MTDFPAMTDDNKVIRDGQRRANRDHLQLPVDIRCELCEMPDIPMWVFRTDMFKIGWEGQPLNEFPQDTEWAACATCAAAVLADDQRTVIQRRQTAAHIQLGGQTTRTELREVINILDMTIIGFLSCRQKDFGRPFTDDDFRAATGDVQQRGRRA